MTVNKWRFFLRAQRTVAFLAVELAASCKRDHDARRAQALSRRCPQYVRLQTEGERCRHIVDRWNDRTFAIGRRACRRSRDDRLVREQLAKTKYRLLIVILNWARNGNKQFNVFASICQIRQTRSKLAATIRQILFLNLHTLDGIKQTPNGVDLLSLLLSLHKGLLLVFRCSSKKTKTGSFRFCALKLQI